MNVLYVIPFLWCFTETVLALQCYDCDSSKNVACDFGLLSFTLPSKDCASEGGASSFLPSTCTKIVAKGKDGSEYIKRDCGINTGPINNCQAMAKLLQFGLSDDKIESINCYTCDTDKCNSASSLKIFTALGILAACMLYLL